MKRGPAIGGHLPRVSKTKLEQLPLAERFAYHQKRIEIFRKRSGFFLKIAIVCLVIWVAAVTLRLFLLP